MIELQGLLISALIEARDLTKELCQKLFDALPFGLEQAKMAVMSSASCACKRVLSELDLTDYCSYVQKKYGKNYHKVLKNLDKLDDQESAAYAMQLTLEKLLTTERDITAAKCITKFEELNRAGHLTKPAAIRELNVAADASCTEIAGLAHKLIN